MVNKLFWVCLVLQSISENVLQTFHFPDSQIKKMLQIFNKKIFVKLSNIIAINVNYYYICCFNCHQQLNKKTSEQNIILISH